MPTLGESNEDIDWLNGESHSDWQIYWRYRTESQININ